MVGVNRKMERRPRRRSKVNPEEMSSDSVNKVQTDLLEESEETSVKRDRRQRKSIFASKEETEERDRQVFEVSQIKKTNYKEWKKEAHALLPSVKGEVLPDTIPVPTTTRVKDPRALTKIIKKLSVADDDFAPRRKAQVFPTGKRRRDLRTNTKAHVKSSPSVERGESQEKSEIDIDDEKDDATIDDLEVAMVGMDVHSKIEQLRTHSGHLSEKRRVRRELLKEATEIRLKGRKFQANLFRDHGVNVFLNMTNALHYFFNHFMFWEREIRDINGRYGATLASYFIWLRQLVVIEAVAFLLFLALIMIPELINPNFSPDGANYKDGFGVFDIFTGEGYLYDTHLYYNKYVTSTRGSNPLHHTSFCFLLVIVLQFVVVTGFIFRRLTNYFNSTREENKVSGVAKVDCFKTIICGWDFSCRDDHAKACLHKTIARELMLLSRDQRSTVVMQAKYKKLMVWMVRRFGPKWGPWIINICGNLLIIVAIAGLTICQIFLCKLKLYYYLHCIAVRDNGRVVKLRKDSLCPNSPEENKTIIFILPTLFTSITTVLFTKVIVAVGDMECYSKPEYKIYATMIRAGVFYWCNIVVLFVFWVVSKQELAEAGFVAETVMGKELYRLVVIQGIVEVLLNLFLRSIYVLIMRKALEKFEPPEFRMEYACINMFFLHTVARLGVLFCPPISSLILARFVIDFYHQKIVLYCLSSEDTYSIHVSHIFRPFMITFFILNHLTSTFMNIYYINKTDPSHFAGPFTRNKDGYTEGVTKLFKSTKWLVMFTSPGFLIIVNCLLMASLYFTSRWAKAYEPLIKELDHQILQERTDRDLLLKAIFEIARVTNDNVGDSDFDASGEDLSMDNSNQDEETDRQIEHLIQLCQRKKSHAVYYEEFGSLEPSNKRKRRTIFVPDTKEQKFHTKYANAMVKDIVEKRKHRNSIRKEKKKVERWKI